MTGRGIGGHWSGRSVREDSKLGDKQAFWSLPGAQVWRRDFAPVTAGGYET